MQSSLVVGIHFCATATYCTLQRSNDHRIDPLDERIQQLAAHLRILAAGPCRHVKRMIGVLEQLQGCPLPERFAKRLELLERRQGIAGALQEQHRYLHVAEVLAALGGWTAGGMKWKAEKHQPANARQWRCGLGLRCHAAAK